MKPYDYYITPEEYEIAERNGIAKYTLEYRVRLYGWDKERAMTEPPLQMQTIPNDIKERAAANGISYNTLRCRIRYYGWDYERACTEPLQDRKKQVQKVQKARRRYPQDILDLAEENNVKYATFQMRVNKLGWDMYKAATTPIMTHREMGLRLKEQRPIKCFFNKSTKGIDMK